MSQVAPLAFALRPHQAGPVESRRWARYPCNLESSCWPITHPPTEELLPVRVVNISAAGLGLLLDRLEPGTFLAVQVHDTLEESSCTMLSRVVRVVAHGEGRWVLGCTLMGKVIQSTSVSSFEYSPAAMAENGGSEGGPASPPASWASEVNGGPRHQGQALMEKFICEQFTLLDEARAILLADKQAQEQALRARQLELDRRAQDLAAKVAELEERAETFLRDCEQAVPERVEAYSGHSSTVDRPFFSNEVVLKRLLEQQQQLEVLEKERDAAVAELRPLREQLENWATRKADMDAREGQRCATWPQPALI